MFRRNFEKVYYFCYDVCVGLRNLWDYAPLIYRDQDGDWVYLVYLLEFKLARMEKAIRGGYTKNRGKTADKIKICRILSHRLSNESVYYHQKEYFGRYWKECGGWSYSKRGEWDAQYLGKILGKYLLHWWD